MYDFDPGFSLKCIANCFFIDDVRTVAMFSFVCLVIATRIISIMITTKWNSFLSVQAS